MPEAISNTSPLLYLHRAGALEWLSGLFGRVWVPDAVVEELKEGKRQGYDVPSWLGIDWIVVTNPRAMPFEWLSLDLGPGELSAMALALENPHLPILLDDALARRTAAAAGLQVWGTLRVLLEAKSAGLTECVAPTLDRLAASGMWMTPEVRYRVLRLAGEVLAP